MERMTKVCMITIKHSPDDDRLFYKESRSLLKNGYYVYIVSATMNKDNNKKEYANLNVESVNVKTKSIVINRVLALPKLFFKSLNIPAEVYHSHEPETFLVAILLKIFTKKKIIYDVYEYYPDVVPMSKGVYKYFLIFMTHIFEPLFCRFADGIITADNEITKRYAKFNKNVCTLYNFACIDIFESQVNKEEILRKGNEVIIYVGGISEERGIFELIKAINKISKKYPSIELLLVGDFGINSFKKKCLDYIKSNNLERNVCIKGYVSHMEIPNYINSADIGVVLLYPIPKFYKNIPTKQFEYMICSKPVVGSNLPTISRYVNDAKCGILVNSTNIDEIANSILYLIEHPEEGKKMGKNGRKAVFEKYNWEKEGKKLLNFYSKLINK